MPWLEQGEACEGAESVCGPGLLCDAVPGGTNTCLPFRDVLGKPEGKPCVTGQCDTGLRCDEESGRCAVGRGAGEACEAFVGDCAVGLFCSSSAFGEVGTCEPRRNVGEDCPASFDSACAGVAGCISGTCENRALLGQACSTDEECFSGSCIDGECSREPACYEGE